MKNKERELLNRLMVACNNLGIAVDRTAVSEQLLYDRQPAHMAVSNVLYGLLAQHPDNDYADYDMEKARLNLETLEALVEKQYPDRNGFFANTGLAIDVNTLPKNPYEK